jgi:alpha-beta hydrolase superfamily lysophospholipase
MKNSPLLSLFIVTNLFLSSGQSLGQELRRSGFFGIVSAPISDSMRNQFHLGNETGIFVRGLAEGGSAKDAGIRPNDIITGVNGRNVLDVQDFIRTAKSLRQGDEAVILLRRGGERITIKVPVKPRPYETAADVEVSYREIVVDGSPRRVIVTAPKASGRHPAVLYLTGIGCFSQESLDLGAPDAKLLYGLSRAGFVTMRVEKTGMGDSEGPPCDSAMSDLQAEVRSYVAGARALKQYSFVDSTKLFLLGLSIGGVEAPLVAERERVEGLIVVNTVAKPFLEYLLETHRRQLELNHIPYDEIDRRMRLEEKCNHRLLIEKQTPEQVLTDMPGCGEAITYPAPYTFMQEWADLDMAKEWKGVDSPVLIIYGTSDYIASNADHPYLAAIINSYHPGNATLKPIQGMDHYLTKAASMEESISRTPGSPPGEFNTAVTDTILAWLRERTGKQ